MRPGNGRPVSAAPPSVGGAQLPPPIVTVPTPSASPLASPSSRPFPSVTIPSSFGTAPSAPMTSPIPGMGPLPRAPGPARIVSMPPAPSANALGASAPPQRPIPVPGPPQANRLGASSDLSQNPPYSASNSLASSAPVIPETGSNGVPLRPPPQVRSVPPRMSVPNVMTPPSPSLSSSSSSSSPSLYFGGEEMVNKRATVAARPTVPRASTISSASPSRHLSHRKSKSITNPSFITQQANRGENPDAFKFIYQTLLRQILTDGVQLESLRVEEILSTVRTSVYKRRDTTRLLIEKKDKLFLTDLVRLIENFLEEQEEARALIKCQSAIRRWKVLKQFQGLSKEQLDEQNNRNAIYLEITRTEKMYCDQLKLLIDKVVIPLRQLEILPPYHIADIFSNIESVLESHKPLIAKLTEASNNWPFVRGIGKIFLDINNLLKNYGVYVGNFKNSINEIDRLRQEYPKFQAFLDDVNGRFDLDVPTMLLLPVNKISQYELLLSSLGDQCKFDEVEREETLKAYSVLHQSSKVIQINLVQSGELAKILDIQRRLKSDRPMSLAQQGRRFVNMTTCKKNTLILFNDVLVIAKSAKVHRVRKDLNDDKMKVEEQVEIGRLNIVDSGDVNIELQTPTKTHKVSMKSIDDKKDFLGALNILAEEKNRRKVFGVPIIDTVIREERKNGVPYIVEKIIEYLRSRPNDLLQSGIFRVAGKKTEIDELKDIFDKGGENALNLDLSKYSTFSICDTLKLYFRMLPEPVLGLTLYNPFVELMRDETLDEAVQVERARNLIISWTPPFALKVLRYLLKFLQLVASMSHENMMTTSNLSIVFGPTLLWSEVNTLESAMDMPWVNSCVRLLIDHSIETLGEN